MTRSSAEPKRRHGCAPTPQPVLSAADSAPIADETGPRVPWVLLWALLGVGFLAAAAWILGRWMLAEGLHAVPASGYQISTERKAITWLVQAVLVAAFAACCCALVRACRARRAVTLDAALFIGFLSCAWQNPLYNYSTQTLAVNRYAVNVVTWGPYVPGWHGADPAQLPESLIEVGGIAFAFTLAPIYIGLWILRPIERVYPMRSTRQFVVRTFVLMFILDTPIELPWILTGAYTLPSALPDLSLLGGHWYQVSLTNSLAVSALIDTPVAVMMHRADHNPTRAVILNGVDRLPMRSKPAVTMLAGVGATNLLILVYMVCTIATSTVLHHTPPSDTPSYLRPS